MDPIIVPRPKSVRNPDRPVSSLLLAQIQHLHEAERNLPPHYHSSTFIRAIKTEGEAARYIREVTEAIHAAHDEAAAQRIRAPKRKRVIEIAAVADESMERKSRPSLKGKTSKGKKSTGKRGRKK